MHSRKSQLFQSSQHPRYSWCEHILASQWQYPILGYCKPPTIYIRVCVCVCVCILHVYILNDRGFRDRERKVSHLLSGDVRRMRVREACPRRAFRFSDVVRSRSARRCARKPAASVSSRCPREGLRPGAARVSAAASPMPRRLLRALTPAASPQSAHRAPPCCRSLECAC